MSQEQDSPLEIERVWLLDRLPDLPTTAAAYQIQQGYLFDSSQVSEPNVFLEGRVRKQVAPDGMVLRVHTIKRGSGLIREETERAIDEHTFEDAWKQTEGRRIEKTRYKVREGDLTWEVDCFVGFDLVMAEVELPHAEVEVQLPDWLAPHVVRELTEDPRYRNYALATQGLPDDH